MSQLIKKKGITIGELSVKKNYAKNKTAIVFKIFHKGIGSEEDHFVFYEDPEKNDWFICLSESLVSQIHSTNRRLVVEVYSKFRANVPLNIQDFTDLLLEHHFNIFEESNNKTRRRNRFSFKTMLKRIFNWKR